MEKEIADNEVCTDGYCSVCGAIALAGSDRCEDHEIPPVSDAPSGVQEREQKKGHGAALLPGDALASPATTEALPHEHTYATFDVCLVCGQTEAAITGCHHCDDWDSVRVGRCWWCLTKVGSGTDSAGEEKDHGAGLIHQVASPVAETLPRPACRMCLGEFTEDQVLRFVEGLVLCEDCHRDLPDAESHTGSSPTETASGQPIVVDLMDALRKSLESVARKS